MKSQDNKVRGGELRMYAMILFPSILIMLVSQIDNIFYKMVGLLILFALQTLVIKGIVDLIN